MLTADQVVFGAQIWPAGESGIWFVWGIQEGEFPGDEFLICRRVAELDLAGRVIRPAALVEFPIEKCAPFNHSCCAHATP